MELCKINGHLQLIELAINAILKLHIGLLEFDIYLKVRTGEKLKFLPHMTMSNTLDNLLLTKLSHISFTKLNQMVVYPKNNAWNLTEINRKLRDAEYQHVYSCGGNDIYAKKTHTDMIRGFIYNLTSPISLSITDFTLT